MLALIGMARGFRSEPLRLPRIVSRFCLRQFAFSRATGPLHEQRQLGWLLDPHLRGRAHDRNRHCRCLLNVGARVVTVRSLAQAFIVIEDDAPSAVILDHALSNGESSQLCDCVKEHNIPYVLHSGYSPTEYNGAADNAAYVPEPASPQHLVATVEGLLRNRGTEN